MTDPAIELQQAIFKALSQDTELSTSLGADKIFDRVPERVGFPYIVIGRSATSDWSTSTEGGEAIVLYIHTWSSSASRSESHTLQAHVKRILAGTLPPLTDHHLVNLRFQLAETRRDRVSEHFHGLLRFRAVTEPQI